MPYTTFVVTIDKKLMNDLDTVCEDNCVITRWQKQDLMGEDKIPSEAADIVTLDMRNARPFAERFWTKLANMLNKHNHLTVFHAAEKQCKQREWRAIHTYTLSSNSTLRLTTGS